MKKLTSSVSILVFLLIATPVIAANHGSGAQSTGPQQGVSPQEQIVSPSPTGNTIQNQNLMKIQNNGEDSKIQTSTQEQESEGDDQETQGKGMPKDTSPRSSIAQKHMSNVASKVEELLTTKTINGGIGEQIRQIAQEQKTAQTQIQSDLADIDNRKGLLKSLIGPNYQALKNMQKIMEQNRLRIQQLTQLQNELTNQGEITQVQETVQALTEQNTALQDQVKLEEQSVSVFGWMFKLFAK
ncbi:MAG: hypothetical protein ACOY3M_00175 [Patescibacteria group bacterium]